MAGFQLSLCLQARCTLHSPSRPQGRPARWDPSPAGWLQGAQLLPASPRLISGHSLLASRAPWDQQRCQHCRGAQGSIPLLCLFFCHPTTSAALSCLRCLLLASPKHHPAPAAPVLPPAVPQSPVTSAAVPKPSGHCLQGDTMGTKFKQLRSSSNWF